MVAPAVLLFTPTLIAAVLLPPIRVPWFKKVVVEEPWVKLTACFPPLEIVIVPLFPITRVLSVPLTVLVELCELLIVSLFVLPERRPDLALACLFVSS